MTIDIEKILNISDKRWFELNDKNPNDYRLEGVHALIDLYSGLVNNTKRVIITFAENVPENAENVVNYKVKLTANPTHLFAYCMGTALIPKKYPEEVVKEKYPKSGTGTGQVNTL
jgi:hypothetical protein